MIYVIVSVLKGKAGKFNNDLRREVYRKFKAKSSKLPAHFTIKAPFEHNDSIEELEKIIADYCNSHKKQEYIVEGFDHFDDRVIFMDVKMSDESRRLHDELIDELTKVSYLNFTEKDGRNKRIHVTIASKNIRGIFHKLWDFTNNIQYSFKEEFDNVAIYKWKDNTWVLHKEFNMKSE